MCGGGSECVVHLISGYRLVHSKSTNCSYACECIYACMSTCMQCMYTWIYVYVYAMYVHMHVCLRVCNEGMSASNKLDVNDIQLNSCRMMVLTTIVTEQDTPGVGTHRVNRSHNEVKVLQDWSE